MLQLFPIVEQHGELILGTPQADRPTLPGVSGPLLLQVSAQIVSLPSSTSTTSLPLQMYITIQHVVNNTFLLSGDRLHTVCTM